VMVAQATGLCRPVTCRTERGDAFSDLGALGDIGHLAIPVGGSPVPSILITPLGRAGAFARGREDWLRLRGRRDRPGPDWMLAVLHQEAV